MRRCVPWRGPRAVVTKYFRSFMRIPGWPQSLPRLKPRRELIRRFCLLASPAQAKMCWRASFIQRARGRACRCSRSTVARFLRRSLNRNFLATSAAPSRAPPLRERPEDIPKLIEYFLGIYRQRFNRPNLDLAGEARQLLQSHSWPGNVRELRNCLERAAALSQGDMIEASQILSGAEKSEVIESRSGQAAATTPQAAPVTLEQLEREHILRILKESDGNRERAAAILGISSRTLYRKLREYETQGQSDGLATEG